jgi:hypothetical protein
MDFDHVGEDKTANVCRLMNHGWQTILAEIAKCELVCANCHRIRTQKRGHWYARGDEPVPDEVGGLW